MTYEDDSLEETVGLPEVAEVTAEELLQKRQDEVTDLKEQLLRALAEGENIRKRGMRDREDTAKYAVTQFARDLLTVADNLRRALETAVGDDATPGSFAQGLLQGVEITEKELLSAFERHGIKKIDPRGQKFNHELHQAMFEMPDNTKEVGTVVELLQAGYVLHDRLLRPALVGVSKAEDVQDSNADKA